MSLDLPSVNAPAADAAATWKQRVVTALAVSVAVLIVATSAVLMGLG